MKKLFYRLSSSRSLAKIFSMHAQLEERKRVIFPKRLFFAVLGLAAFVSLGAFVFPHVGHAQDCVWDCDTGGADNQPPPENSPGFSIIYCFDQPCVAGLKDSSGNPIFTGNIPTAHVVQTSTISSSTDCSAGNITGDVTIGTPTVETIIAVLKDSKGIIHPESAAQATLFIKVLNVTCEGSAPNRTLSRSVALNELRTNVFDASSNITILPTPILRSGDTSATIPRGWPSGPGQCQSDQNGFLLANCPFPLGIVEFNNNATLSNELPATGTGTLDYGLGEVYLAVESAHFVGVRDCKGDANGDSTTIACSVGGFKADMVYKFPGNWAGAKNHTINPKSGSNPYDIFTSPLPPSSVLNTPDDPVTASANGGVPQPTIGCSDILSKNAERCSFIARDLLPNGCTAGLAVNIVVTGHVLVNVDGVDRRVKFESSDNPTCSTK